MSITVYLPPPPNLPVYLSTSPGGPGNTAKAELLSWLGKSIEFFDVFLSCHRLCLILFPSLSGEKKPVFFVCSDCGLLGQGGSHKPSKSETLWSRFFDLLLFIALVVMEWKTVYLYSNGVNLKKKVLLYKYFIFYHCINIQYWLTYVLWLQVLWSSTQWVNKKETIFLWILDTISNAIDVLTILL